MVIRVWSRVRKAIFRPSPGCADHPVARDAHVVEEQLAGGGALDAELALLLPEGEAGVGLLHDEGADVRATPAVGVGDRQDGVVLGHTGVGDPRLLAVEHPVVAVGGGAGAHRGRVAAGLTLGQRVRERGGTLGQRAKVLLLQLLRAGEDQRGAAELVGAGDQRGRGADPGDLLDDDGAREGVGADAAVLLGDVRGVEVGGDERVVCGGREGRGPVDLSGVGADLVLGDGPDRLADGVVVLGDPEQVEGGV